MAKSKKEKFTVVDKRRAQAAVPVPTCPNVTAVPLGSKVLVWRIPEEQGTILQADIAQEKPLECEVVAVSTTGLSEFDTQALALLKQGDKVLIRKNSGTEIKVEGHELTVLHVMDILLRL
jgi:chaperonin GroES